MTIQNGLRGALSAVLLAVAPGAAVAQAPAAPSARTAPVQDAELQTAIAKSNAYTALMNRTLRAIQSWERYGSWVDLKKGPTGKERYIGYGLYSLYDVTGEIRKAEEFLTREPKLPAIDASVAAYIKAYQELAPLITRAERYYDRKDYRDDNLAEGQKLHGLMVPAAQSFLAERARLDALMRDYKKGLDQRELASVEQREGRSARWQIRNVMINARSVDGSDAQQREADRRSEGFQRHRRRLRRRNPRTRRVQGQEPWHVADDRQPGRVLARQTARFFRQARQEQGRCPPWRRQRRQLDRQQLQHDGQPV